MHQAGVFTAHQPALSVADLRLALGSTHTLQARYQRPLRILRSVFV